MTVSAIDFTALFPEFMAPVYSPAQITAWLAVAEQMTDETAWGTLYTLGVSLFAAHQLTLGRQAELAGAMGGATGQGGVASSKTIDKVSVSYDTTVASVEGAGNWNLTSYGARRYQLARMFGAGGVQL